MAFLSPALRPPPPLPLLPASAHPRSARASMTGMSPAAFLLLFLCSPCATLVGSSAAHGQPMSTRRARGNRHVPRAARTWGVRRSARRRKMPRCRETPRRRGACRCTPSPAIHLPLFSTAAAAMCARTRRLRSASAHVRRDGCDGELVDVERPVLVLVDKLREPGHTDDDDGVRFGDSSQRPSDEPPRGGR